MKTAKLIVRWMMGAGCVALSFHLLGIDFKDRSIHPDNDAYVIVSMCLLVGAVFFFIPEIVTPITEYFGECWGNIVFPNARFDKPPLAYHRADFYRDKERYTEALIEYKKIIRYYPGERRAWLEFIALCKMIGDTRLSEKYEKRFRRRFQPKGRVRNARKNRRWF